MTSGTASVETHVAQTFVDAPSQRNAPDRHQTLGVVDLEEDPVVANASSQHPRFAPDGSDASPPWLDAEVTEKSEHGRPRAGRKARVLPMGRRPQLDPVAQATPSRAMLLHDFI